MTSRQSNADRFHKWQRANGVQGPVVTFYFSCEANGNKSVWEKSLSRMETFFRLVKRDIRRLEGLKVYVGFVTPSNSAPEAEALWQASIAVTEHAKTFIYTTIWDVMGGVSTGSIFFIACDRAPDWMFREWFQRLKNRKCSFLLATKAFPDAPSYCGHNGTAPDFLGYVEDQFFAFGIDALYYTDWLGTLERRTKLPMTLNRMLLDTVTPGGASNRQSI